MAIIKQIADATKKVADAVKKVATENKASSNSSSKSSSNDNAGSWISNSANGTKTNTGTTSSTGDKWVYTPSTSGSRSSSSSSGTYEDEINNLKKAQQRIATQQLKQQRDSTLKELERQERDIPETYQTQRNAVSTSSQQGARSFAEYLANRGLSNSGAAAQGEINRISTLQNNLNSINNAETKAIRDIVDKRYDVNANYAQQLADANLKLEADYLEKIYAENQRKRLEQEELKKQALYQYSDDYQARINELLAQGYSPNGTEILQLQTLRAEKMNNINNGAYRDLGLSNIANGNINYNNAIMAGFNSVEEAQKYYDDLVASQKAQAQKEAEQQAFDNYIKEQTLLNDIRNTNSLISNRNSGGGGNEDKTYSYNFHDDVIESRYIDESTGTKIKDTNAIANYINEQLQNGTMNEYVADQLRLKHNISKNNNITSKTSNLFDSGTELTGGSQKMVDTVKNMINGKVLNAEQLIALMEQYVNAGYITEQQARDIMTQKGLM